ncbi:MAG: beta-galactosidase, partial [Bacteroidetes bacterium]
MKRILFLLILIPGLLTAFSQQFLEQRNSFQLTEWKFYKGDYAAAQKPRVVIDGNWEEVSVPHTWNAKDILNEGQNNYYRGVGWYRTNLNIEAPEGDKRYFIRFEGVGLTAEVFVNGKYIGNHKGAYSAFCFDITSYLNLSGENLVAVRADNSIRHDVAPNGVTLYPVFGGIYRPVTVFETSNVCISPLDYSSSGVYIKQDNVSNQSADISVETIVDYNPFIPAMKNDLKLFKPYFQKEESKIVDYYDNSP